MARVRVPRHAAAVAAPRRGTAHGVLRLRPDRAQLAARQSHAADAAAPLPAPRPQTHRADGRRHRTDWRPERQAGRAPAALARADPREPAAAARSDAAAPRLRHQRDAGPGAEQRRLAGRPTAGGLPARRRQALQRERHAAEGVGAGAAQHGHLLHRIQLHVAAGLRFSAPVPQGAVHHPGRRQRPVGEHHRGDRLDPPRGGGRGARPGGAARHHGDGIEVWQDRGRRDLARPRNDVPLQIPPILGQYGRPRRGGIPQALLAQAPRRGEGATTAGEAGSRPARSPARARR